MFHSPAAVADWVRDTLPGIESPAEAPATARLRLVPSPLPRGESVSVAWDGERTADAIADLALERLSGLQLAERVRSRIELLDGAGHPIPKANASRTWLRPPHPEPQMSTATDATPSGAPTLLEIDEDLDGPGAADPSLDEDHMLQAAERWSGADRVMAAERAGTTAPPAVELHGVLALRATGMALLAMHRTNQQLLANSRNERQLVRDLADELRRASGVRDGLLEEVLPSMITAVGAAAEANADARVAESDAAHSIALAEATDDNPAAQTLAILREAKGMLAGARIRKRAKPEPDKPAAEKPAADKPAADKPEPDKPAADQPESADDELAARALSAVLSGEMHADFAASAVMQRLDGEEKAHAIALARAILATSGSGAAS